jgi:hypothetical protein
VREETPGLTQGRNAGAAGGAVDDQAMLGVDIGVSQVPRLKERPDGAVASVIPSRMLCRVGLYSSLFSAESS